MPGTVRAVHGLPARGPKDHLHHERDRDPQLPVRKIIKNRGHFPTDDAVVKLIWLAIMDIEDKRARERAKKIAYKIPHGQRKASGRLVEGAGTFGWKAALAELSLVFPDRINPHL